MIPLYVCESEGVCICAREHGECVCVCVYVCVCMRVGCTHTPP